MIEGKTVPNLNTNNAWKYFLQEEGQDVEQFLYECTVEFGARNAEEFQFFTTPEGRQGVMIRFHRDNLLVE